VNASTRTFQPTSSYALDVPVAACEEVDGRVMSLWLPNDETLLQLSSNRRAEGLQVLAKPRLDRRLQTSELEAVRPELVALPNCEDVAAASGKDSCGTHWLYVYAVWSHVAVFASISSSSRSKLKDSWAYRSLTTLRTQQRSGTL